MNDEKVAPDFSDDELSLIREEATSITDDWAERQLIEPTRKETDAKFVREILRLCADAAPAQPGEPHYLIERRDSTPTVWWKGPRWADVTADPAKATRYGSRYAAERQMNIFGDDSLFVSEHLDVQVVSPHREQATGLSRHQCNAIEYFVNQMRDVPSHIYIDMLDAFRDYVNSLVRDVPATPQPTQTERALTFAPLYKKLMCGDVDICEAYLRLKVVGSCPTQEEFCTALEALLANGAAHE